MTVGTKNVMEWFSETGKAHWTLYYRGAEKSGQPVFCFDKDEDQTVSEALDKLRKNLAMLDRGSYSLTAMDKPKANGRGAQRINFEINAGGSVDVAAIAAPAAVGGISKEEMTKAVAEGIAQYKLETELAALRAENAQLKKEAAQYDKSDPMSAVVGALSPYLPHILGLTPPAIAGFPQPIQLQHSPMAHEATATAQATEAEGIELTDDEHARLSNAISIFKAVSPDEWLTVLEKMATKLKAQPSLLGMLKTFL